MGASLLAVAKTIYYLPTNSGVPMIALTMSPGTIILARPKSMSFTFF